MGDKLSERFESSSSSNSSSSSKTQGDYDDQAENDQSKAPEDKPSPRSRRANLAALRKTHGRALLWLLCKIDRKPPTSRKVLDCARPLALCCGALLLATSACSKKPNVQASVSELEKAFPQAVAAGQARPEEPPPNRVSAPDANTYVSLAISAVRSNDYAAGVVALQTVQRIPGVTPQQLMALERAKQAITADLVARAAAGDPKAKAELSAIEKTLSQ